MPKVTYSAAQGLVQSAGSGFSLDTTVGITNNDFFAGFIPNAASSTVTTGAVSIANYCSFLNGAGGATFTLANGTAAGQLKKVMSINNNSVTLTLTSPISAALDVIAFTSAGDTAELIWTGSAWRILALYNTKNGNVTTPTVS